ncbi:MAG: hypothetical protein KDE59_30750, partial [Anaerolineales bacterium]|nr:hypothetical protein [Anaerolineales bacterium]
MTKNDRLEKATKDNYLAAEAVSRLREKSAELEDSFEAAKRRRAAAQQALDGGAGDAMAAAEELEAAEREVKILTHARASTAAEVQKAEQRAQEALATKLAVSGLDSLDRYHALMRDFMAHFAEKEPEFGRCLTELATAGRQLEALWQRGGLSEEADRAMRRIGQNRRALERVMAGAIEPLGDQLRMVVGVMEGQAV